MKQDMVSFLTCPKLSWTSMSYPARNRRISSDMGSPLERKTVLAVNPIDSL